jgi:hypothetical protein
VILSAIIPHTHFRHPAPPAERINEYEEIQRLQHFDIEVRSKRSGFCYGEGKG